MQTITSIETYNTITSLIEDNEGNFIVKQDGEVIHHTFSLLQAMHVFNTLIGRTVETNA